TQCGRDVRLDLGGPPARRCHGRVRRGRAAHVARQLSGGVHGLGAPLPARGRAGDPGRAGLERGSAAAPPRRGPNVSATGPFGLSTCARLIFAASIVVCWPALCPSSAWAHARLLRTDPPDPCAPLTVLSGSRAVPADLPCTSGVVLAQPPRSLRLFFNER